jgi:hypothetical protein
MANGSSGRGLASSKVTKERRREIASMGGKARGRQRRKQAQMDNEDTM